MDWYDLGVEGGDNDVSVAFALGYCLRVVKRFDNKGYNTQVLSISGLEIIGFTHDRDAAQMQLEGWVKQKGKEAQFI
jgi:hypothetical protein